MCDSRSSCCQLMFPFQAFCIASRQTLPSQLTWGGPWLCCWRVFHRECSKLSITLPCYHCCCYRNHKNNNYLRAKQKPFDPFLTRVKNVSMYYIDCDHYDQCWAGWVAELLYDMGKLSCCDFLGCYECDKWWTLHGGTTQLYLFIPLSVTLTIFQGHSYVEHF